MTLAQALKTIVAINNKRKRIDEHDNQNVNLESIQLASRIAYEYEKRRRVWRGDKK